MTHFSADKAYDKSKVYQAVQEHSVGKVTVTIPPIKNSVTHHDKPSDFGSRNHNVSYINEHGFYRWQAHSDYNYRALVETAMYCYKTIIGDKLYSCKMSAQKVESRMACVVLNKMTALGIPKSIKVKTAA